MAFNGNLTLPDILNNLSLADELVPANLCSQEVFNSYSIGAMVGS